MNHSCEIYISLDSGECRKRIIRTAGLSTETLFQIGDGNCFGNLVIESSKNKISYKYKLLEKNINMDLHSVSCDGVKCIEVTGSRV